MKKVETQIWETVLRCQNRRVVICENGAAGIVCRDVAVGDLIVVLAGRSVPIILGGEDQDDE
jgi:hypothetical protein